MSDIKLNLNDFKAVLGQVNDGNVRVDERGKLVKVNYGGAITSFFRAHVTVSPGENAKIRRAFMSAIVNSREGRTLQQKTLDGIRERLGLGDGSGEVDQRTLETDLSRHDIQAILKDVTGDGMNSSYSLMADQDAKMLVDREVCFKWQVEDARTFIDKNKVFASPESMVEFAEKNVPATLYGFTTKEIVRFVRDNAAQLKELAFVSACYELRKSDEMDSEEVLTSAKTQHLFFDNVGRLMKAFARHSEPSIDFYGVLPKTDRRELAKERLQLTAFKSRLEGFDGFINALFPDVQVKYDEQLAINQLRNSRANQAMRLQIRKVVESVLVRCANDADMAMKDEVLKPFAGLLSLTKTTADDLSAGALRVLRRRFFARVAKLSCNGADVDQSKVIGVLVEVLRDVTDALDREKYLSKAFGDAGLRAEFYDGLREEMMSNAVCGDTNRQRCDEAVKASLRLLSAQLDGAGDIPRMQSEIDEKIRLLKESFAAAEERRINTDDARKDLIENFCTATDSDRFNACINGDRFVTFRSKMHLAGQVLTPSLFMSKGIQLDKNYFPCVIFSSLSPLGLSKGQLTEKTIRDNNLWDAFMKEVQEVEKKVDELLVNVSSREIKARKQYYNLETDASEGSYGKGKSLMLDAMRDGLIPDGIGKNEFTRFLKMFYGALPLAEDEDRECFYCSDCLTVEAAAAEFEIRIAEYRATYPDREAAARGELATALSKVKKPEDYKTKEEYTRAIVKCYAYAIEKHFRSPEYTGFGSTDVIEVFKLFSRCNINIARLTANFTRDNNGKVDPPDLDRALALMRLIKLRGGSANGIVEWYERVSGRPISELTRENSYSLLNGTHPDPLDKLPSGSAIGKVARLLKGEYLLSQSGIKDEERVTLYKALENLNRRLAGDYTVEISQKVNIGGVKVELSVDGDTRQLVGRISSEGKNLPIAYPMTVGDFAAKVQNDIVGMVKEYIKTAPGRAMLLSLIPGDEEARRVGVSRARELCVRIIAGITGRSMVDFSSMSMSELVQTAKGLIEGNIDGKNLMPAISRSYNSQEVIELGTAMLADKATVENIVWTRAEEVVSDPKMRENQTPPPGRIRDFIADLVMNKNTWLYDVESRQEQEPDGKAGSRILKLLKGYAPEVRYILQHHEALNALSSLVAKEQVLSVINAIRGLHDEIQEHDTLEKLEMDDERVAAAAAEIDRRVKTMMTDAVVKLQQKVSLLFQAQKGDRTEFWKKPSAEINGKTGIDDSTEQGRFYKSILDSYFSQSSEVDKRAMLSSFIRNVDPIETEKNGENHDGKIVGEVIKGAGPLLQKLLQGLPSDSFPPETRIALEDTRSKLSPIPREVVNARLANMIASSNGFITKIEVKKSLGAASVAEALLCRIYTKNRPVTGEEVVIKILRPNVETAVRREYELISAIAREQGESTVKSFNDRYRGIIEEFDLTVESGNIDRGAVYNHAPVNNVPTEQIEAMGRCQSVLPTTGAIVLQKVDGQPFSSFVAEARERFNDIVGDIHEKAALEKGGETKDVYTVKDDILDVRRKRFELQMLHSEIIRRREQLMLLVRAWIEQAFRGGFVHGDMHSGNILSNDKGLTVIDFGNCTFLTENDRDALLSSLVACVLGAGADTENPGSYLIACLQTMSSPKNSAKYDSAYHNAELNSELGIVMRRGSKCDVVTRMLSSLTLLQKYGYPLPGSVSTFVQSLSRLQAAVSETDTLLCEIEEASDEIGPTEELKSKFGNPKDKLVANPGGFQFFRDLDQMILNSTNESGRPPVLDEDLAGRLNVKAEDLLKKLKSENPDLVEKDGGLALIQLVQDKYGSLDRVVEHGSSWKTKAKVVSGLQPYLMEKIEKFSKQIESKSDDPKIPELRDSLLTELLDELIKFATKYAYVNDVIIDHNLQTGTFEDCAYNAMQSVLRMRLGNEKEQALLNAKTLFCGSMGTGWGVGFGAKVGRNMEQFFARVLTEDGNVKTIQRRCSNPADEINYVTRRSRMMILLLSGDLLVPSCGITKSNLEEVVNVNLARLRKLLGREHLSLAELRYFACLVEQQNWSCELAGLNLLASSKYSLPYKNLDQPGVIAFLKALHESQRDYLLKNNLDAEALGKFDGEVEKARVLSYLA